MCAMGLPLDVGQQLWVSPLKAGMLVNFDEGQAVDLLVLFEVVHVHLSYERFEVLEVKERLQHWEKVVVVPNHH